MNQAVVRACAAVGGQASLAKALDVKPPTVSQWIADIRQVPIDRCVEIEQLTGQIVRCEDLRPDKAGVFAYLRARTTPSPVTTEGASA